MNTTAYRVCLCAGLAIIAVGACNVRGRQNEAVADTQTRHGMSTTSARNPHAAHRPAPGKTRYAVRDVNYDVPDVQLIDASGATVALPAVLDSEQPVALDFVFTTCTTICPIMTATFAQMQRQLGDMADQLQLVSISIDPEYDRPDVLAAYAKQFHASDNWTFLTGDSADIVAVLRSFDAYAGSKMNHQPIYLLKRPGDPSWIRIDGLASGESLANEVTSRLLN
jgi:protein SCO1/2